MKQQHLLLMRSWHYMRRQILTWENMQKMQEQQNCCMIQRYSVFLFVLVSWVCSDFWISRRQANLCGYLCSYQVIRQAENSCDVFKNHEIAVSEITFKAQLTTSCQQFLCKVLYSWKLCVVILYFRLATQAALKLLLSCSLLCIRNT